MAAAEEAGALVAAAGASELVEAAGEDTAAPGDPLLLVSFEPFPVTATVPLLAAVARN